MKHTSLFKTIATFGILHFMFCIVSAQAPAQCDVVMLQGFYWDSNAATSWSKLYQISGDISGNFDVVWLPPSAFSSGGTGYMPKQWSNQNSAWGTKSKLLQLIATLATNNCRAMADIVVNHRDTKSTWTDFWADDFGQYGQFQLTNAHICSNDEASTSSAVPAAQKPTGAPDTGENFDGTRDLDHTSTYVQDNIKAYIQWMRNVMGFDGWRYDMVKGFGGSYINAYNSAGGAYMSVGEYWDTSYSKVLNWINATAQSSMAFDFPQKYAALNNGLQSNNYAAMQWADGTTPRPAGLIHSSEARRYAVTFVDNHDTYRDNSKYTGDVQKAYAFIFSAAGVPCVFYPHWTANKMAINAMIAARKAVGLHSESDVVVQNTSGYYKAYSVGTYGEMLTYIGSGYSSDTPQGSGWTLACDGVGWAMYIKLTSTAGQIAHQNKINNGVNPPPLTPIGTITLTAKVPAEWTAPKVWVWNTETPATNYTGGTWPGTALTPLGNGEFSITLTGVQAKEVGVIFNSGQSTGTAQTIDLTATASTCWTLSQTATAGGRFDATESNDCSTSAIDNVEYQQLVIYPNPLNDELRIINDELKGDETIQIMDITGKIIHNSQFTIHNSIDVSALSAGIYFVKAGKFMGKFVKNK